MDNDSDDDLLKTGGGLGVFADVAGDGGEAIVGRQLGDYRITGLIAEGGMGRVYRASRIDGSFERDVAIKISPVSGFSESMRQRFAVEQGVLAGLNHPNIAQLYDAQVTKEGWPYIVMELVDGGPVTTFCVDKPLEDRIQLLIDIVDAIAYAHSRLVIHRDIKPSNILVGEDGRAKLLDFGIAKLLEGDERDLTRAGPMTPRYASPEQLLGQAITTASDTYQLGILILEVASGETPNKDEVLSTAIQRAAERKSLSIDPETRQSLPRELVLIIEQCLRVSPEERYIDAGSLKRDLQAYLDGYPVSAAGQGAGYRFRKFVSRNVAATVITAAAVLTIVGGGSWYTWQLADARDLAERRAETSNRVLQTMSQLVADTFSGLVVSNAERNTGDESYVESVLSETAGVIREELESEPEARAELLRVQGNIETVLGNIDSAAAALDEAYRLIDSDVSPEAAMQVLLDRVEVAARSIDMETARAMLADADDLIQRHEFEPGVRAAYHHQTGQILQFDGDYPSAVDEFTIAINLLQEAGTRNTRLLAETYEELSYTYTNWNRFDEGGNAATRAIEILEESESSVSHRLIHPLRYAGFAALMQNELDVARQYYERAERIAVANFGALHPDNAAVQDSLGALAYREGRLADAAGHFEEQIRIMTALEGPESENLLVPYVNAALMYGDMGRMEQAGEYSQRVLTATANDDPAMERFRFVALDNEGRRYFAIGDFDRAVDVRAEEITLADRLFGKDNDEYHRILAEQSAALARAGRVDEARSMFLESLERYGEKNGTDSNGYASWSLRDWPIEIAAGNLESAERKLRDRILEKVAEDDLDVVYWVEMLGIYATLRMDDGDFEGARQVLDWAARGAASAPGHPWTQFVRVVEADYWDRLGDRERAIRLAEPALRVLEERFPKRVDDIRRARAIIDS